MAKITPKENGPLIVQGLDRLRTPAGDITPDKPVYGLCRCGQSANKPFCDGAHVAAGFTSENDAPPARKKAITYRGEVEGEQIAISYTPALCGHIAACQVLQKSVFDPAKKPWIQPEHGTLEGIRAVVRACPSGALRLALGTDEPEHLDSAQVSVKVQKNGPYIVKNVPLEADFNGDGASEKEYILCRCGLSKNKPFCDGTHFEENWRE